MLSATTWRLAAGWEEKRIYEDELDEQRKKRAR